MDAETKRSFKDELYEQFARIGKAFSSPKRLEMLDLLAQTERSVEALAEAMDMSVANTSRHLQMLRKERLVRRRKDGTYVYYALASPDVHRAWKAVRTLAEARLPAVKETVRRYLTDRDRLDAITADKLEERLESDETLVLDVRPAEEYRAGHIPGARSVPVDQLEERLDELPEGQEIVAYCRGPYCVYSDDAVRRLQENGLEARRLEEGIVDWVADGRPVADGGLS